jgi:hypothetical protein
MISHHQKLTAIRTTAGGTDNRNSNTMSIALRAARQAAVPGWAQMK